MECDNCGKEIEDFVYSQRGLNYNACSVSCISELCLIISKNTVEQRMKYLGMNQTIHKYPLEITDHQTIQLPSDYRILTVDIQDGKPYLWAAVDLDSSVDEAEIVIHATGDTLTYENCSVLYISTFFLKEARLVFHAFHITE